MTAATSPSAFSSAEEPNDINVYASNVQSAQDVDLHDVAHRFNEACVKGEYFDAMYMVWSLPKESLGQLLSGADYPVESDGSKP